MRRQVLAFQRLGGGGDVHTVRMLRGPLGGIGHPMVALRLGVPATGVAAATGRRATDEVVDLGAGSEA